MTTGQPPRIVRGDKGLVLGDKGSGATETIRDEH